LMGPDLIRAVALGVRSLELWVRAAPGANGGVRAARTLPGGSVVGLADAVSLVTSDNA